MLAETYWTDLYMA